MNIKDRLREVKRFESQVTLLCKKAEAECQLALAIWSQEKTTKITRKMNRLAKVATKLSAIAMIDDYPNTHLEQSHGARFTYNRKGTCINIKLNGQKSATIKLWGGRKTFPTGLEDMNTRKDQK